MYRPTLRTQTLPKDPGALEGRVPADRWLGGMQGWRTACSNTYTRQTENKKRDRLLGNWISFGTKLGKGGGSVTLEEKHRPVCTQVRTRRRYYR